MSSLRREMRVSRRSKGPSKLLRVRVKPRSGFCRPRPSGRAFWVASAFGVGTLTAATCVVIKTCSPYVFFRPAVCALYPVDAPGVPARIVRLAPSAISRRRLQPSNGKIAGAGGNESPKLYAPYRHSSRGRASRIGRGRIEGRASVRHPYKSVRVPPGGRPRHRGDSKHT